MAEMKTSFDVGDEIFTYCTRCKTEMYHVVTKISQGQIQKVMCKGCNTTHTYKEGSEASSSAKKANGSATRKKSGRGRRKKDWETLQANLQENEIVDYRLDRDFSDAVAIRHSQFGIGIIHKVLSSRQIEVVFKEGTKILVHNYKQD